MQEGHYNLGHLTFWALPTILTGGWLISLFWMLGLESRLIPSVIVGAMVILTIYSVRLIKWSYSDLRWLIAPICVVILADQLPWWQMKHVGLTDGMYHMIQANHYIGEIDNFPYHQGQDFLFRPPIVPAVLSIELLFSNSINYIPLILLSLTCWQLQHLSERWNNKFLSSLIIPAIILVPVFRYWGQLPYADIPVAGLWIFLIHIAIQNPKSKRSIWLLGCFAGLVFLTKYVFIYAISLSCWLFLKDKSRTRAVIFLQGWFTIASPFLLFYFITQGDPLAALSPQTNFAIDSAISVVGEHDVSIWWEHLISQISIFGVIGFFIGIYRLYFEYHDEMKEIMVLLLPLIILHIFILDFGTERYHTPWIALMLCICIAGLPISNTKLNLKNQFELRNNLVCAFMILLVITSNISTIDEEIETSERDIPLRLELFDFHMENTNGLSEDSILLTGHDMPVILTLDIEAYRFIKHENVIGQSISEYDATHIITSNWSPRYQWEKYPIELLGNPYIEPLSVNIFENKLGILWEVNNSVGISPLLQTNASEQNVFGDLLVLYQDQTVSITSNSTLISWIEVEDQTPINDVLMILTTDTSLLIDGCFITDNKYSSCEMNEGETLSTDADSMIFAWFGETT